MVADMHIHTKNSDGQYSTIEIVEMVKKLEIELFSITDHDNITSCKEMERIVLPQNIKYITGVEFSAINNIYDCHILGYNFDYKNAKLIETCNEINTKRKEKIKTIINHLQQEKHIEFFIEELNNLYNKETVGRYDICKLLMERNLGTKSQIYDNYLTDIKDIKTHRIPIEKITEAIKTSNGVAILAHPKKIENKYNENLENIIKDFIEKGIDGIEVYNSIHTLEDIRRYLEIAKKYDLLITGGSDFHGESHPERKIGTITQHNFYINGSTIRLH